MPALTPEAIDERRQELDRRFDKIFRPGLIMALIGWFNVALAAFLIATSVEPFKSLLSTGRSGPTDFNELERALTIAVFGAIFVMGGRAAQRLLDRLQLAGAKTFRVARRMVMIAAIVLVLMPNFAPIFQSGAEAIHDLFARQ